MINALIGLPDVTQTPVAALTPPEQGFIGTLPISWPTGGGTTDTPITFLPYTPIYPLGPGPVIPLPVGPGPPVSPPVTPPITIPSAPEPSAWITMTFGFALIGTASRRRTRAAI